MTCRKCLQSLGRAGLLSFGRLCWLVVLLAWGQRGCSTQRVGPEVSWDAVLGGDVAGEAKTGWREDGMAENDLWFDAREATHIPDIRLESIPGKGEFGSPCKSNGDCPSGWCVAHLGDKQCTNMCVTECPPGWVCEEVPLTGTDTVWICKSLFPSLCLPCTESKECEKGKCVVYGDLAGAFCGANCPEQAACPPGYHCKKVVTVEGATVAQCVLSEGECSCTALAAAELMETRCFRSNEWGKCAGIRICTEEGLSACNAPTPEQESCDGKDNDCNGLTDEMFDCDDGNECTEEGCDNGQCVSKPLTGTHCDDGDKCTQGDHCDGGVCVGESITCDDLNPCTDDVCESETGCVFAPVNGVPCEDDGNVCTEDICLNGECTHPAGNDGIPCDDGEPCTQTDVCQGGKCIGSDVLAGCTPCGDGVCKYPEDWQNCPDDCGYCGDTFCGKWENAGNCPQDCLPACGNGKCEGGEDAKWCIVDCGGCGDEFCGLNENEFTCPGDCPPACGDGICGGGETPITCLADCSPPCGDGACVTGENAANCPVDCTVCGDGVCGKDESMDSCPVDCKVVCGNGKCEGGENPKGCPLDCGWCGDGVCGVKETQQSCPVDCMVISCGNGKCEAGLGENSSSCPADCLNDLDEDNVLNIEDNCPYMYNPDQGDHDGDGLGDACDPDDDGDGEKDISDCAPLDSTISHFGAEVCDGKDNDCDGEVDEGTCDDGNPCTDDICDPEVGCNYTINTAPCDDGNPCTVGDKCKSGECQPGPDPLVCDDNNPCTSDICIPESGCTHVAAEDNTPCGDGPNWVCKDGQCLCIPSCAGKQCGDDGCGGSCGMCQPGVECKNGLCLVPFAQPAAASKHTCALKEDGTVWCWGENFLGQLGDGTWVAKTTPVQVKELTGVTAVAARAQRAYALKTDGTLWYWGNGETSPVHLKSLTGATEVSVGWTHTCALKNDETVWCWGKNSFGQVGDGTDEDKGSPVQVKGLIGATGVAAGYSHTCAVKTDGTVWCWGGNDYGQLGDGTKSDKKTTPVQVKGLTGATAVAAGWEHTCALKNDGTVWCWGDNYWGQLGDGSKQGKATPVQLKGLTGATGLAAGEEHTCALKNNGTVWCWGNNENGQLGDGTTLDSTTPVQVKGLTGATAVAVGDAHTCAVKTDGTLWCWGDNYWGQLGDGTIGQKTAPVQVKNLASATAVAAGGDHSCASGINGTVWCWGKNENGQLGDGTTLDSTTPVQVKNLDSVTRLAAGGYHTCALKEEGTVWCWGGNEYGQLGDGSTEDKPTPVQVKGLIGATAVTGGSHHTCALKADGTVWCWGHNHCGQLGDGTTALNRTTPVQVKDLTSATEVAAGGGHSCALKSNGTVWCWGDNNFGQLGDGTSGKKMTIPVVVKELSDATQVAAGMAHTCALKTDGTVWCWGNNLHGELGDVMHQGKEIPVEVKGLTDATGVTGGSHYTCALKADGTVWCWGDNKNGQLGDGTTALEKESPGKVKNLAGVSRVAAGVAHTCALKADGTVWCWGNNENGQLGDESAWKTTPVQVVGYL